MFKFLWNEKRIGVLGSYLPSTPKFSMFTFYGVIFGKVFLGVSIKS